MLENFYSIKKKRFKKKIKSDNTPVSNGDLEVNKIIIKKNKRINTKNTDYFRGNF